MTDNEIIAMFIAERSATVWCAGTARLRRYQLAAWSRHLGKPLGLANRADLIGFLASIGDISARRSALSAVTGLYRWGREMGLIGNDPTLGVRPPRQPRGVPRPMPDDLFWSSHRDAPVDVGDMMILARFAGLRCDEIARTRRSWLIGERLIVPGKGGHCDPIPAHPRVQAVFLSASGWLFPSPSPLRPGDHLTAGCVSKRGNLALAPDWTMHKLRHAYGTEVYEACHDLGVTQSAMRHASPVTTRGYARLCDDRVALAVLGLSAGSVLSIAV